MQKIRQFASVVMVTLLVAGPAYSAPPVAMLQATVATASGKPMAGVQMRMVSLDSGRAIIAATNNAGLMTAELAPGLYTVNTMSGYRQVGGPRVVSLASGQVLAAALAYASPEQAPSMSQPTISIDAPGCMVAGKYPQFSTVVVPADNLRTIRLYFKSSLSPELFYVNMVPGVGNFLGTLPPPTVRASPITYYVEVTGTGFESTRTIEYNATVVEKEAECAGRKLAPIVGSGPATAFTATGAAVVPGGFGAGAAIGGAAAGGAGVGGVAAGATGGGILGLGTTGAILVGGGLIAAGAIVAVTNDSSPSGGL